MLVWLAVSGCTLPLATCESDADCASAFGVGWACDTQGTCVQSGTGALNDVGTDTGPVTDTTPDDTGEDKPIPLVLIINEVLYDPSNAKPGTDGLFPGDANGDGTYVHDDDEFVELVNISGGTVDISGYALYDQEGWDLEEPRHVVPPGSVLLPGQALVVFGGGVPTGTFGKAMVQLASGGLLNLNNANDALYVTHPSGALVASFDVTARSDNPNESYTRLPDITGAFEQHGNETPLLFSPGTRTDGSPFR